MREMVAANVVLVGWTNAVGSAAAGAIDAAGGVVIEYARAQCQSIRLEEAALGDAAEGLDY